MESQITDSIALETLTENYIRQAQDGRLPIEQKVEAMTGTVRNIGRLSAEFMASEQGSKAIGVSLSRFRNMIPAAASDETFKPVRGAIMTVSKTVAEAVRKSAPVPAEV